MPGVFSIVLVIAAVAALVDIVTRDDSQVQHLPKLLWVLIVVLVPLIGTIVWFLVGHDWETRTPRAAPLRHRKAPASSGGTAYRAADVRSTEQQLADLDREIEYYRRRADDGDEGPTPG